MDGLPGDARLPGQVLLPQAQPLSQFPNAAFHGSPACKPEQEGARRQEDCHRCQVQEGPRPAALISGPPFTGLYGHEIKQVLKNQQIGGAVGCPVRTTSQILQAVGAMPSKAGPNLMALLPIYSSVSSVFSW